MELRTYWRILLRRWWLVAVPVVLVTVYAVATTSPPGPVYQVVMRFAAGTEPAGLSEDYDRYYPWLASEYIANGLADVAMTGAFAEAVADRLADQGLEVSAQAIQAGLVTDNAQSILVVYFSWGDPVQAVTIGQAIGQELTTHGAAYFPQLTGVEPAVRALDSPRPIAHGPGLRSQLMGPAVKIGLGFAVGIGLALLFHYLDPTVRLAAEVEAAGLPVLARIPRRRWWTRR